MRSFFFFVALWLLPQAAMAQFRSADSDPSTAPTREPTLRIRAGLTIEATGGTCFNIVATAPVPTDWPEQSVRIVGEDVSSTVKSVTYRSVSGGGGLKQMVVEIPQLFAGQEARALITFEVTHHALALPADTSRYVIPKKLDRQMMINLGPSPYIESRHPKLIAASKEATLDKETDWQKAEAIYDWTRQHVTYASGEIKGAARALYDKEGGADELTSVFIALCRAAKIPARTVFVPGHCYAEFYLVDDQGEGRWFPCQPAGMRSFGTIDEARPILQKGDNFKNPENTKERQRYVTEYLKAAGRGRPKVHFVSELVAQ